MVSTGWATPSSVQLFRPNMMAFAIVKLRFALVSEPWLNCMPAAFNALALGRAKGEDVIDVANVRHRVRERDAAILQSTTAQNVYKSRGK
jgi:hypothetical protein